MESARPAFVETELGDVVEHRPVSKLAVAAVVIAAASPLAIFVRVMWLIPIVGVVVSIAALGAVLYGERRPYGRKAAVIALLVSLFVLGCAPTRYLIQRSVIIRQSRKHADTWLAIVRQGNLPRAHQLTRVYAERLPRGTDLEVVYKDSPERDVTDPYMAIMMPSMRTALNAFFSQRPVKTLAEIGEKGTPRFVEIKGYADQTGSGCTTIALRYDIDYEENGVSQVLPIELTLERQIEFGRGMVVWRVAGVHDA